MISVNQVATTEDWIGGTADKKLTSYDLQCISAHPANSISVVMTQTDLELRPAHRSLKEKARGEMSDFERRYPW
jgi:hypothetical protein